MAEVKTPQGLVVGLIPEPKKAEKPEESQEVTVEQSAKKRAGRPRKDQ